MTSVAVARNAMATRFEILLQGANAVGLRAAGEEALAEIERLDEQLSLYRPTSEISRINARAAREAVRLEPSLFRLLQHARRLSQETSGAFDITVAPLMRCWGFIRGAGRFPEPQELENARRNVGMHWVVLDESDFTVRFARPGMMLDLGAIGKGYALDRAAAILREAGVSRALLQGGTSTAYAIGTPPDADGWKIAVKRPGPTKPGEMSAGHSAPLESEAPNSLLAVVNLKDESFSVSAVWGKSFEAEGKRYGHVIDPRTGQPVAGALLAAVALPSATETDALSTALLTLGPSGLEPICNLRAGAKALVVAGGEDQALIIAARGIEWFAEQGCG